MQYASTQVTLNTGFKGMKIQIEAKHTKLSIKWILEKIQYEIQYAIKNRANYDIESCLETIKTE